MRRIAVLADGLGEHLTEIGAAIAGIVASVVLLCLSSTARWFFPGVGYLYRMNVRSRVLRTLGILLEAGKPVPEALAILIASGQLPAEARRRLRVARSRTEQGEPLADCLYRAGLLPRTMAPLVRAAERARTLPWALSELGEHLNLRSSRVLQRASMVLAPTDRRGDRSIGRLSGGRHVSPPDQANRRSRCPMSVVSANIQHALESRLQPAKAGTPAMQPNYARPPGRRSPGNRPDGFTIAETLIALGILAVAMLLVAQVGVWSLQIPRTFDRQAAQELAANVLETARASPWDALNSEWAASQKLPPGFANDGWRLAVQVDSDASRPLLKRVSVQVDPRPGQTPHFRPEELVGWFSARATPTVGEKR